MCGIGVMESAQHGARFEKTVEFTGGRLRKCSQVGRPVQVKGKKPTIQNPWSESNPEIQMAVSKKREVDGDPAGRKGANKARDRRGRSRTQIRFGITKSGSRNQSWTSLWSNWKIWQNNKQTGLFKQSNDTLATAELLIIKVEKTC